MDDTSGWARRIVKETILNREKLRGELEDRGLRPLPSRANFLLIPVGPGSGGGLNEGAIQISAALKACGVAVRPFPRLPEIGDAIRVSIGPWALLERFLDAIDQLLEEGRAS